MQIWIEHDYVYTHSDTHTHQPVSYYTSYILLYVWLNILILNYQAVLSFCAYEFVKFVSNAYTYAYITHLPISSTLSREDEQYVVHVFNSQNLLIRSQQAEMLHINDQVYPTNWCRYIDYVSVVFVSLLCALNNEIFAVLTI